MNLIKPVLLFVVSSALFSNSVFATCIQTKSTVSQVGVVEDGGVLAFVKTPLDETNIENCGCTQIKFFPVTNNRHQLALSVLSAAKLAGNTVRVTVQQRNSDPQLFCESVAVFIE